MVSIRSITEYLNHIVMHEELKCGLVKEKKNYKYKTGLTC